VLDRLVEDTQHARVDTYFKVRSFLCPWSAL